MAIFKSNKKKKKTYDLEIEDLNEYMDESIDEDKVTEELDDIEYFSDEYLSENIEAPGSLTRIDISRIKHMHGVAEYMSRHAIEYNLDPDKMYLLGWLHDIGYMQGKEGHERFGGNLVGLDNDYGRCILVHGMTPNEYITRCQIEEKEIPSALILLWQADMLIDENGRNSGYKQKLYDIGSKYGKDSEPYRICNETIEWLKVHSK